MAVGATTVAMASATFGLIIGSMIGGPIGKRLIEKNNLLYPMKTINENDSGDEEKVKENVGKQLSADDFMSAKLEIARAKSRYFHFLKI